MGCKDVYSLGKVLCRRGKALYRLCWVAHKVGKADCRVGKRVYLLSQLVC